MAGAIKTKKVVTDRKNVDQAKRNHVAHSLASFPLAGEIITWSAKADVTHTHKRVVQALTDAGLDPKVAKEILPRHAFTRAAKQLAQEQIIDVLREDADFIVFQFTSKMMANAKDDEKKEWVYKKNTNLTLDKITGRVTCKDSNLEAKAQTEIERCMEERTTSDITKIVQKLFEANADLFSIRDQGGAYFVPKEHVEFLSKVQVFLEDNLGGRINRFPVPAGSVSGDRAIADSIATDLGNVITEHEEAVKTFSIHTRPDTMEGAADRIKKTRVKVEAYAHYLKEKHKELVEALDKADKNLRDQISKISEIRANAPPDSIAAGARLALFGYSVTAVIRWMGKEGYDFDKCQKALAKHSITVADATIRAQLLAGRKGERGDPAKLTPEQAKQL